MIKQHYKKRLILQFSRKTKHGLNKGQLVAALKRYEKNPTVEKVIGPAYLSKIKNNRCEGESSGSGNISHTGDSSCQAAGYVPFSSVKMEKSEQSKKSTKKEKNPKKNISENSKKSKKSKPLVPYDVFSDSSEDATAQETKTSECFKEPRASFKYREYNNNSTCPKVKTQSSKSGAIWDLGSGNLGSNGNATVQTSESGKMWGSKSEFSDTETEGAGWDQDLSDWLADITAREIEDELLEKLEKQHACAVEEDLSEVIDIHKQREESVKKLSTWGSEGQLTECQESQDKVEEAMEVMDLEEELEAGQGKVPVPEPRAIVFYVPEVYTLVDICKQKLKTMLKVSYHNSMSYWVS